MADSTTSGWDQVMLFWFNKTMVMMDYLVGVSGVSGGVGWPSCTGGNRSGDTVGDGDDVRASAEWAKPHARAGAVTT